PKEKGNSFVCSKKDSASRIDNKARIGNRRMRDYRSGFSRNARKIGWSSTNHIRTGFGGGISHFQSNQAIYLNRTTVNYSTLTEPASRRHLVTSWTTNGSWRSSSRSLNSLCLLREAFTLSKLVVFVIGSLVQFRNRFRSLSNVNRSGSQNASKNAAAAAEKTE